METISPYAPTTTATAPARLGYFQLTRTATYSFLIALPLFVAYEVLIVFANDGALSQVRVGAEVWMKRILTGLGGNGLIGLGAAVLVVGIGVLLYERKKKIPIHGRYFGWMVLESIGYAVVLGILVGTTVGALFNMAVPQVSEMGFGMQVALSLGAGLYEELLFRVILVGGLFWVLAAISKRKQVAYILAAVIGALLFSWVHYIGSLGDAFTLSSFTFRFLFGLALNALFLLRGFGIAAWTHALYDVTIAVGAWG